MGMQRKTGLAFLHGIAMCRLLTSQLADGVGLAVVTAEQLVHLVDHIRTDGRLEHCRQADVLVLSWLVLFRVHGDQWPGVA